MPLHAVDAQAAAITQGRARHPRDTLDDKNTVTLCGCCGGGICARCAGWATGASEPGSHSPATGGENEGRGRPGERRANHSAPDRRLKKQRTSQPVDGCCPFLQRLSKFPSSRQTGTSRGTAGPAGPAQCITSTQKHAGARSSCALRGTRCGTRRGTRRGTLAALETASTDSARLEPFPP